jgi:hypothetical protein
MATSLTTITNTSTQVIPILINSIDPGNVNANATIAAKEARQLQLPPGSETKIETQRIDNAQLERLQSLRVITFTTT